MLNEKGNVYEAVTNSGTVLYRPRPEARLAAAAWDRALRALVQLGLTPRSRGSVEVAVDDDEPARCGRRAAARSGAHGGGARQHQPVRVARAGVPDIQHPCSVWAEHKAVLVAHFVKRNPGRRPARWWTYDAPRQPMGTFPGWWCDGKVAQPRLRLGGTGTAALDVFDAVPDFHLGIPVQWCTTEDVAWCAEEGIHAVLIEPTDPPIYEAQATYLGRHGLLAAHERRRLPADAFEPEVVTP